MEIRFQRRARLQFRLKLVGACLLAVWRSYSGSMTWEVRHMGFVVDEVALGQDFPEYFCFPRQIPLYQMLHTHLSSGAGKIGHTVADVPSGLSLTPVHEIK
jgi:hypothetical protein